MSTALVFNVYSQVSMPESRAFCPKNYVISVTGGTAAPHGPYGSYACARNVSSIS